MGRSILGTNRKRKNHIHKKYWRRGFAKEAARAVRGWVFTNTDYNEIYSYMKYTNVGSYSTAIAIGM